MAKKSPNDQGQAPFDLEQALKSLEALVERMEHGELSLEQALHDFEQGVALTRRCEEALRAAEQRVQLLMQKGSGPTLEPFEPEGDAGA